MKMSLKQKILDRIVWLRDTANSGTPPCADLRVEELKNVLVLLDEVFISIFNLQTEAFARFTTNPNKHDRYWAGQVDAFTRVLVVLEGEK